MNVAVYSRAADIQTNKRRIKRLKLFFFSAECVIELERLHSTLKYGKKRSIKSRNSPAVEKSDQCLEVRIILKDRDARLYKLGLQFFAKCQTA